jgi:hypothetical protein
MNRDVLPTRRFSETFSLAFAGEKYDVTAGFYPDQRVGEVFINRVRDRSAARLGNQLDGVCRDGAILLSLALQHGVSIDTIRHAITREGDEPATIIGAIVDHVGEAAS